MQTVAECVCGVCIVVSEWKLTSTMTTALCWLALLLVGVAAHKFEGEWCASQSGAVGVCELLPRCKMAAMMAELGLRPEICSFSGNIPVVCCIEGSAPIGTPETSKPTIFPGRPAVSSRPSLRPPVHSPNSDDRKSSVMCKKYSQQVTETVEAIPLLPNPEPVSVDVEKCDYSGLQLIVGGEKATVGEFPHMAVLGYRRNGVLAWLCGGTLVSEKFVLTAAHCTYTQWGPPVVVRLGELNLKRSDDGASPVDYNVEQIVKHPKYQPPAKYHDIALLRLDRQVSFNKDIRPACLYTRHEFPVNKTVATGWGRIDYAEAPSDHLLKVAISIIDSNVCNNLYKADRHTNKLAEGISSSMLCAGELQGGKDTCQGDSGGPIQITSRENQCVYYIIGITSFGKFCAAENAPGVYTRVSSYVPWLEAEIWPH